MQYKRIKNDKLIIVKDFSSIIEIYNINTEELVAAHDFSDHIKAITLAKQL